MRQPEIVRDDGTGNNPYHGCRRHNPHHFLYDIPGIVNPRFDTVTCRDERHPLIDRRTERKKHNTCDVEKRIDERDQAELFERECPAHERVEPEVENIPRHHRRDEKPA